MAATISLKRRLLVSLLVAVAGTWVATAVVSYIDARHRVHELLDAHLAQSTALLVAQVGHDLEEIDTEHAPQLHKYGRRVAFQIWEDGRELRLHSQQAPERRLSARDEGFSNTEIEGRHWRVFSSWDARHKYLVQVAEQWEVRQKIVGGIGRDLLWPLVIAVPALALLIWVSVARATRPLRLLGRDVAARDPLTLQPLEPRELPSEVVPVVFSLNQLFERVRHMVERERRFTADAAHELRTPIAGLRAQTEVARGATDARERNAALDHILEGCDRASRLVDQMLTLARLEPAGRLPTAQPCTLRSLARTTLAELAPEALARQIELVLADGPEVTVRGEPALLAVLVRNLVDNAVRYSPSHTRVLVTVSLADSGPMLIVEDQGPGMSEAARAHLGERFFRVAGTGESGSGLGLSIVKRIAELHAARVAFEPGPADRGLRVIVSLPPV